MSIYGLTYSLYHPEGKLRETREKRLANNKEFTVSFPIGTPMIDSIYTDRLFHGYEWRIIFFWTQVEVRLKQNE